MRAFSSTCGSSTAEVELADEPEWGLRRDALFVKERKGGSG
jgi:hypothetical protein